MLIAYCSQRPIKPLRVLGLKARKNPWWAVAYLRLHSGDAGCCPSSPTEAIGARSIPLLAAAAAMRVARGACIEAPPAPPFSMLQKLPLAHPLTCRPLLGSCIYQAFRGYYLCHAQRSTCQSSGSKSKARCHPSSTEFVEWWAKKMEHMKKPIVKELIKRLSYSNLLGLDQTLKNGSCREGSLNDELLAVKAKYPREVLLCRVGEFYEAVGFDACVLVEYASLNPMSGLRIDTVPRAGCPVMNLRQTLDALTSSGFSVCVYEEVKGPCQARQRKDRFVSGHAHPGSPYVYGLAEANVDLDVQEEVFVTGVSRSSRGYCLVFVSEMMRTYSVEDYLTEEAAVARLRANACFQLFLHRSLQMHSSGLHKWRECGEGGLLWAECQNKPYEWFDHDPVAQLLSEVRLLYSLDPAEQFREVVFQSKGRPHPLSLGAAAQVGIIPTPGVPCILKVLLPANNTPILCSIYLRNLLLKPPTGQIARSIQAACKLMLKVRSAIPDLLCVSAAKLVKLINSKEANHLEFSRIRRLAADVILMHNDEQLSQIVEHLLKPVSSVTGLEIDQQILVQNCNSLVERLDNVLAAEDDPGQLFCSVPHIPDEFFQVFESSWKGRINHSLANNYYKEVQNAAYHLNSVVEKDFVPIVLHVRASDMDMTGSSKAEIVFSRENDAVWLKLRNVPPSRLKEFAELLPAEDDKGKRAKENLYSTISVESALERYRTSVLNASNRVYEILRDLAEEMKGSLNTVVYTSFFAIVAKTLFAHVSEGARRHWNFPELVDEDCQTLALNNLKNTNDSKASGVSLTSQGRLVLKDLKPYWIDTANSLVVANTIKLSSMNLLTGPNGGGKSSILRAVGAAALLGMCGLMVPCSSAVIPRIDAMMLRMIPQDSPADGKSSFQMEMSELRTILQGVTSKSLVLVDEICRGTEVQKGAAIAASTVEFLDSSGCIGILSTHLHDLLHMQLDVKNLVYKAMGTTMVDGMLKPTWKLRDGYCRESLAFETARCEGVAESVIERAKELYAMYYSSRQPGFKVSAPVSACYGQSFKSMSEEKKVPLEKNTDKQNDAELEEVLRSIQVPQKDAPELAIAEPDVNMGDPQRINGNANPSNITNLFEEICKKKLSGFQKSSFKGCVGVDGDIYFTRIGYCEQPPPGMMGYSCVYLMLRPDGRFYVGQTDNINGRIRAHRAKPGLQRAPFFCIQLPNKSVANELETVLLNELPSRGVELVNKCDQTRRHFATKLNLACESPF